MSEDTKQILSDRYEEAGLYRGIIVCPHCKKSFAPTLNQNGTHFCDCGWVLFISFVIIDGEKFIRTVGMDRTYPYDPYEGPLI